MEELLDTILFRISKIDEISSLLASFYPPSALGASNSGGRGFAAILRSAKSCEKIVISKENTILNHIKKIKCTSDEMKRKIVNIMGMIRPDFEVRLQIDSIEQRPSFLQYMISLYQDFFLPFQSGILFKYHLKIFLNPTNPNPISDMVKYLVHFTRDFFAQFIEYWELQKQREYSHLTNTYSIHWSTKGEEAQQNPVYKLDSRITFIKNQKEKKKLSFQATSPKAKERESNLQSLLNQFKEESDEFQDRAMRPQIKPQNSEKEHEQEEEQFFQQQQYQFEQAEEIDEGGGGEDIEEENIYDNDENIFQIISTEESCEPASSLFQSEKARQQSRERISNQQELMSVSGFGISASYRNTVSTASLLGRSSYIRGQQTGGTPLRSTQSGQQRVPQTTLATLNQWRITQKNQNFSNTYNPQISSSNSNRMSTCFSDSDKNGMIINFQSEQSRMINFLNHFHGVTEVMNDLDLWNLQSIQLKMRKTHDETIGWMKVVVESSLSRNQVVSATIRNYLCSLEEAFERNSDLKEALIKKRGGGESFNIKRNSYFNFQKSRINLNKQLNNSLNNYFNQRKFALQRMVETSQIVTPTNESSPFTSQKQRMRNYYNQANQEFQSELKKKENNATEFETSIKAPKSANPLILESKTKDNIVIDAESSTKAPILASPIPTIRNSRFQQCQTADATPSSISKKQEKSKFEIKTKTLEMKPAQFEIITQQQLDEGESIFKEKEEKEDKVQGNIILDQQPTQQEASLKRNKSLYEKNFSKKLTAFRMKLNLKKNKQEASPIQNKQLQPIQQMALTGSALPLNSEQTNSFTILPSNSFKGTIGLSQFQSKSQSSLTLPQQQLQQQQQQQQQQQSQQMQTSQKNQILEENSSQITKMISSYQKNEVSNFSIEWERKGNLIPLQINEIKEKRMSSSSEKNPLSNGSGIRLISDPENKGWAYQHFLFKGQKKPSQSLHSQQITKIKNSSQEEQFSQVCSHSNIFRNYSNNLLNSSNLKQAQKIPLLNKELSLAMMTPSNENQQSSQRCSTQDNITAIQEKLYERNISKSSHMQYRFESLQFGTLSQQPTKKTFETDKRKSEKDIFAEENKLLNINGQRTKVQSRDSATGDMRHSIKRWLNDLNKVNKITTK